MGNRNPRTRRDAASRSKTSLADALFSSTQQRLFGLLFGQTDREFSQRELISLARSGSGGVQRELERLVQSGLVIMRTASARQKYYRANPSAPIFDELRAIVEKTAGVAGVVRDALAPIAGKIRFAVLYGSVAKNSDTSESDIDVLVVSDDATLEEIFEALEVAERKLGRRVSPTLYTSAEFRRRRAAEQPFLTRVLAGRHAVLLGSEDALATR